MIHTLVEIDSRPVALRLIGRQVHGSKQSEALLDAIAEGANLPADEGYDSSAIQ